MKLVCLALFACSFVTVAAANPCDRGDACDRSEIEAVVARNCLPVIQASLAGFQDKTVFDSHPVEPGAVCSCAAKRFMQDRRLLRLVDRDFESLVSSSDPSLGRSYFQVRVNQVIAHCFAAAMDKSLQKTALPK
jgi:hypothetical protein